MKGLNFISRREFLKLTGVTAAGILLKACRSDVAPTLTPTKTPVMTVKPQPAVGIPKQKAPLEEASTYYLGYATEENLEWVNQFDVDVLTRGFLLFLNTSDAWIPAYQSQITQCQENGRYFLVAIQAAVLVDDIKDIPRLSEDDPALDVPMERIPEWETYACRTPEGLTIRESKKMGFAHACLNNPGYQAFLQEKLRTIIDSGADGVHIDELNTRYFTFQEGYCDACNLGLRDYLNGKYTQAELDSLYGITSIGTFDFRERLARDGHLQSPPENPLHKEWWTYQLSNLLAVEREVLSFCKTYAEQRGHDFIVNTNAFEPESNPERLIEMTLTDFAAIGTGMNIHLRVGEGLIKVPRIPPLYSYTPLYQLAKAITPQKPVTLFIDGPGGTGVIKEFSQSQQGAIVGWMFSEANAAGAHFHVPYPSLDYHAPLETCQRYVSFLRDHGDLFQGTTHLAEVGVLFSFATEIWDYWIQPGDKEPVHHRQWYGLCQALTDLSIQYKVVFAPDGSVLPDTLSPNDFEGFQILIVPWVHSLSDSVVTRLTDFANRGKKLIIAGDIGLADEGNRLRDTNLNSYFQRLGAEVIPVLDFEAYLNDPQGKQEPPVLEILSSLVPDRLVTTSNPMVTAQINQSGNAICLHLINKDLRDSGFVSQKDTLLKVNLPQEIKPIGDNATYFSPEQDRGYPVTLPLVQRGNSLEVTLPQLEIYGILVFPIEG